MDLSLQRIPTRSYNQGVLRRWTIRVLLVIALGVALALWRFAWLNPGYDLYTDPSPLPAVQWQHGLIRFVWVTSGVEARIPLKWPTGAGRPPDAWGRQRTVFRIGNLWLAEGYYHQPTFVHEYAWLDIPIWPLPVAMACTLFLHLYRSRNHISRGFPVQQAAP